MRAQGDEQIETEDGGRQDERQGHQTFEEKLAAPAGAGNPIGQRRAEQQQYDGDATGKANGEPESFHYL